MRGPDNLPAKARPPHPQLFTAPEPSHRVPATTTCVPSSVSVVSLASVLQPESSPSILPCAVRSLRVQLGWGALAGLCRSCVKCGHSCGLSQGAEKPERLSPPNSRTMDSKHLKWPGDGAFIPGGSWSFFGLWGSCAQLWVEDEEKSVPAQPGISHQVESGTQWALCESLTHQPLLPPSLLPQS